MSSAPARTESSAARREDTRLLTGRGRYVADLAADGEVRAAFVRSPHAHARIRGIDTGAAAAMPGVHAVLTGADLEAMGIGAIPWDVRPPGARDDLPDGAPEIAEPQPLIVADTARYMGQIAAMVVAETEDQARDAAEAVDVDWEDLPAVAVLENAVADGTPALWPDRAPGNVCFTLRKGDAAATEAALAGAAHVVSLRLRNNRITANPMEPRNYLGAHDPGSGRFVLHTQAGAPYVLRRTLAQRILQVPEDRLRIVIPDVGGGFGMKNAIYPEEALVLVAARLVGRPVRWIGDRSECLLGDLAGRDQVCDIALGLDAGGRFLGLKVRTLANLGAYLAGRGVISPANAAKVVSGCYRIPAIDLELRGVHTNTVPTAPYRGAGQPEQVYFLERIVDAAARETGIDPADLRRRNLLGPGDLPYDTPCGFRYDDGDFPAVLERALAEADWPGFSRRRESAKAAGRLRGIGVALSIEAKAMDRPENADVRMDGDGVTVAIGTISSGQGHETAFARLTAARLQVPEDTVTVIQGDTDRVPRGGGTAASRSITIGGSAIAIAADVLIENARRRAADRLEAAPDDIDFVDGDLVVRGTDRRVALVELAAEEPLSGDAEYMPANFAFPYGCHVAEVSVDADTGTVRIEGYRVVHDAGVVLNPDIVVGQLHGGLAQGLGQGLLEELSVDAVSGQVVAGTFMDYAMPRADDLTAFDVVLTGEAAGNNPLGVRPVGETGPTGAPPAVVNAIIDALSPLGVTHVDMPATPQAVWRAIRRAAAQDLS